MRKKITLASIALLFFSISSVFWAYTPSQKDLVSLEKSKQKIYLSYDENPQKPYEVKQNIWEFYTFYKWKEVETYFLKFIEVITDEYIKSYEEKLKIEEEKKKEEDKQKQEEQQSQNTQNDKDLEIPKIDNVINDLNNKLSVLTKETTTVSKFEIEPKDDNVYLKNVYLRNFWTVSDISRLFEEVYLVNEDNRIYSKWYAKNWYLYFDLSSQVLLKEWAANMLYVKAVLRQANNQNETWELKFELSTPSDAVFWTLNWINAISYANWKYVTINNTTISNPIITYITYNDTSITSPSFDVSYSQWLAFGIFNNSKYKLELKAFDIKIQWSARPTMDENTRFVVRVRWTNQIFGSALLKEWNSTTWVLRINYWWWDAYNYISPNENTEYIVEIDHTWANPEWNREMRLDNIIIWDWFGWTISDLNQYSNTGLPWSYYSFKY